MEDSGVLVEALDRTTILLQYWREMEWGAQLLPPFLIECGAVIDSLVSSAECSPNDGGLERRLRASKCKYPTYWYT